MERSNSGDKGDLRDKFEYSQYWFDEMWKSKMARGRVTIKSFNIVMIRQDKKSEVSRSFRTQSH